MTVVGSDVIGNLCPKGNVWCSVPVGCEDGTSGTKRTVCHWGLILSFLPFYLKSCFIFPFANWRHAGSFQGELPSLSFKLQSWPPQKLIAHLIQLKEFSSCHRWHPACPHLALCGTWGCCPHAFYRDRKIKSLPFQVSSAWLRSRSWIRVHLSNSELTMWFLVLRSDFLHVWPSFLSPLSTVLPIEVPIQPSGCSGWVSRTNYLRVFVLLFYF